MNEYLGLCCRRIGELKDRIAELEVEIARLKKADMCTYASKNRWLRQENAELHERGEVLHARMRELEAKLIAAEELHLADEQSLRNLQRIVGGPWK